MIKVGNLTKMYKVPQANYKKSLKNIFWPPTEEKVGVREINFQIDEGEIVGLVGQNGAGKTTTIKMLSGILTPTAGEMEVCGLNPYQQRKKYTQQIGVLMGQRSILFYDIPVIESFKFYKDVYSLTQQDFTTRLDQLTEKLELQSLLNIPVRKLSLGQRMRCEIVASLLHNPKVLFLDEPTIGLDIIAKQQILDFLNFLNQEYNTTILLTTHDLNDIDRVCNRIIILDKGQVYYDGDLKNIKSRDQYKIVEVVHHPTFKLPLVQKGKVIESTQYKTRIKVAKENFTTMITYLNSCEEVIDLNINLVSLEEIVREIYQAKEGEVSYG